MSQHGNDLDLVNRGIRVLSRLTIGIAILIGGTLMGCATGVAITAYLDNPDVVRWVRLDSPEKFVKILAADVDYVYMQSATGKVFYRSLTDDGGQWKETSTSAVSARGGGPMALDSTISKPPGKVVELAHGEMHADVNRETRYALTDDGQVWSWRFFPSSIREHVDRTLLSGFVGLLAGVFILISWLSTQRDST